MGPLAKTGGVRVAVGSTGNYNPAGTSLNYDNVLVRFATQ